MYIINKIKSIKGTVLQLLLHAPPLRDDDSKLISTIWYNEVVRVNPDLSAKDFLILLRDNKLTNPEAIIRARRKVQEKEKFLRGDSYKGRKSEEVSVREEINNID